MMDPDRVAEFRRKLLEVMASGGLSVHSNDYEIELAVKPYERHINGKLVRISGYDRLKGPDGKPPTGKLLAAVKAGNEIIKKWRVEAGASSDRTKDFQRIVNMLLEANSPFTQELKKKMAKGNLSTADLKREYERIAMLFLRALAKKGPVHASGEDLDELLMLTSSTKNVRTYRRVSKTGKVGYVTAHPRTRESKAVASSSNGSIAAKSKTVANGPYVKKKSGIVTNSGDPGSAGKEATEFAKGWQDKFSKMTPEELRTALLAEVKKRNSHSSVKDQFKSNIVIKLALLEMQKRRVQQSNK